MGSLPNLNELCLEREHRRAMEKERDLARERVRERDFHRGGDKDHKPSTLNAIGGICSGGGGGVGGGISAAERLTMFHHQTQLSKHDHQQHHRHSLTSRKVHRTRSSGATHHIWDDPMIEHMAAYSPISTHSHRITLPLAPYQIQLAANAVAVGAASSATANTAGGIGLPSTSAGIGVGISGGNTVVTTTSSTLNPNQMQQQQQQLQQQQQQQQQHHHHHHHHHRRRESVNSSIGATSIRRLLAVNRGGGCRHKIPLHIKSKVVKNFIFLVIAHCLTCAILIPLFGLQGSSSTWFHKNERLKLGPNIGSLMLSMCFLITSAMCLLTMKIIKKLGYIIFLASSYIALCIFLLAHIYPSMYTLVPAYMLLGVTLGPAWITKWNLVVFFASRISCGQYDCSSNVNGGGISGGVGSGGMLHSNEIDDHKMYCNRDERVRRLARWYHAGENLGIVIGATLASLVMTTCFSSTTTTTTAAAVAASTRTATDASSRLSSLSGTSCSGFYEKISNQIFMTESSLEEHYSDIENKINLTMTTSGEKITGSTGGGGVSGDDGKANEMITSTVTASINSKKDYNYDVVYVEPTPSTPPTSPTPTPIDITVSQSDILIDSMFNTNEYGERICGADSCPVSIYYYSSSFDFNYSSNVDGGGSGGGHNNGNIISQFRLDTHSGTMPLIIIYFAFGLVALTLTCLSQQIDNSFKYDTVKGMTDTLLFAGPMAYFIGTEQAYVLGDFTKAFVSCSLGPQIITGALIGMGIMQLIVSCTLSMLLRHTKRYAVMVAGFFFHACLLLVLSRWKPSTDDSALFFVIAAAWGACNGMWETLMFALITLTHVTHVIEVASPINALRYLGLGITFAAHGFLCENAKILILFILLVLTVVPYGMFEVRQEAYRKNHQTNL